MKLKITAALTAALLVSFAIVSRSAESLPAQIGDADYWKMISEFSEPNGYFQYEIITSNELTYQSALPELLKMPRPGGAYLGVGPEQNFTYIAALQPKIAFVIDIRREMMLEHLMYKAVFEMSPDRADFMSNLFSRKRPAYLNDRTSVRDLLEAYAVVPSDPMLAEEHLKSIMDRLKTVHHFPIAREDENQLRLVYLTFLRAGVVSFNSSFMSPGYATLMTMTDRAGKNWSYLATKENYDRVRAMHQKNLIVPLVGDFGGPKTIRAVGQYLKDHATTVNTFYLSNVEDYIAVSWRAYVNNIGSLPIDSSSVLMRWFIGGRTSLESIGDFLRNDTRRR